MTFLDTPSGMHLLWLAALLLVPLAAVVAGRGLVVRYMDSQLELAKARAGTDYLSFREQCALSYPPFRASVLVRVYAALVAAECAGGAAAWGGVRFEHQGAGWHIYLEHPGPFGVILQPAIALLVASSLALPLGVRYGCALGGTGVFAVMWLVAGAFGCLLSNAISVSGGPQLLPVGGALALAATVWLLTPRPGGSTFSRAQRAGALAERRFAAVALHELPGHGEYEAPHTRGIWGNLQSSFFVPSTVPRHVRWDEEGIEVEWLRGGPTRYHWDEVRRLENAANAVHVITSDGRTLEFYNTGRNYGELLSALRAHTWARNQDQAPGDADT